MAQIFETENFFVESVERPFVSREEGGHIRIMVKDESITDRTKLTPQMAIELMRLSMIVGEAFEKAMNLLGIKVIKINYQDMGNWAWKQNRKPLLHYHIFGRVMGSIKQPFPESVYLPDRSTGFYDGFIPLHEEDCRLIRNEIEKISNEDKYNLKLWGLD